MLYRRKFRFEDRRDLRELRHRSYLVTPNLDKAKQALLTEYNVVWIPMDAQTFAEETWQAHA